MIRTLTAAVSAMALVSAASAGEPVATGVDVNAGVQPAAMTPEDVQTRDDAARLGEAEFILADADADGYLSETEFALLEKTLRGADEASGADAGVTDSSGHTPSMFSAVAGEDAKVSKEELAAARVASFDAADADLNRALSESERQVFAALIVAPKPEADL